MPSFRTKRGRCHVDADAIRLESSLRGQLRRYWEGNRFLFAGVGLGLFAFVAFVATLPLGGVDAREAVTVAGIIAVLVVARVVARVRGFTADDEIPLDAVSHVAAVEGTKGLTRPRFVVYYHRDGTEKKRYVMMPSRWLSYGDEEFERAKRVFRERGVDVVAD